SASRSSRYFPIRTSPTSGYPSACNDCCTAFPCGSRIPSLGVTYTRASHPIMPTLPPPSSADASRDLLIGFLDPTQIAAESILVHLLARARIPEPTRIRADLVPEDDLAVAAAEFELHVDEHDAALREERLEHRVRPFRELHHAIELGLGRHLEDQHVPLV